MVESQVHIIVKRGDTGIAVEDVQRRLNKIGYLKGSEVDCIYGEKTIKAINSFCRDQKIEICDDVTEKIWSKLVDATFTLGDRNLYLSMPYFHGSDVLQLQKALGSLGFQVYHYDGIFGPSTELALRKFQINMGLPNDGIAGSQTFTAIKNLQFTWNDKNPINQENATKHLWRKSEVLEKNSICLFGTNEFTRDVAVRMSNLARATNPFSKVMSSNAYSVAPDKDTMLLHIVLPDEQDDAGTGAPRVAYSEDGMQDNGDSEDFILRLASAIPVADKLTPSRMTIELPGKSWMDAGEERSAQHFAITVLDSLCFAIEQVDEESND